MNNLLKVKNKRVDNKTKFSKITWNLKKNYNFFLEVKMESDSDKNVEYFKRPHLFWYGLIIPSMTYLGVSVFFF